MTFRTPFKDKGIHCVCPIFAMLTNQFKISIYNVPFKPMFSFQYVQRSFRYRLSITDLINIVKNIDFFDLK